MQRVQQALHAILKPENAFENPHGKEVDPVRYLQEAVRPARKPQVAQAAAHEQPDLHLRWRLPEEVRQRQQTAHSPEEEQMRAQQSRGSVTYRFKRLVRCRECHEEKNWRAARNRRYGSAF